MSRSRPLLLLALSFAFLCQTASAQDRLAVELIEIREDLQPYEDSDRYDFIEDDFEYFVIEEEKYDEIFRRSALLAAQLYQLRETGNRYGDGQLDLAETEDTDFLTLMAAEAAATLPDIVSEAHEVAQQMTEVNPKKDFWRKPLVGVQALRGLKLAGDNLRMIVAANDEIGDLLSDFEALQKDIDMVESEQAEG